MRQWPGSSYPIRQRKGFQVWRGKFVALYSHSRGHGCSYFAALSSTRMEAFIRATKAEDRMTFRAAMVSARRICRAHTVTESAAQPV